MPDNRERSYTITELRDNLHILEEEGLIEAFFRRFPQRARLYVSESPGGLDIAGLMSTLERLDQSTEGRLEAKRREYMSMSDTDNVEVERRPDGGIHVKSSFKSNREDLIPDNQLNPDDIPFVEGKKKFIEIDLEEDIRQLEEDESMFGDRKDGEGSDDAEKD